MNQDDFMEMVVRECQVRSCMTYTFSSKRKLRKFEKWFRRKGVKHYNWSKWKAKKEFLSFCKAFNVTINGKVH